MTRLPTVISLDVGGTLIEPWPSVGVVYAEAANAAGLPELDPAMLNRQFFAAWRTVRKLPRGFDYSRGAWADLVRRTFGEALPADQADVVFESIWHRFIRPEVWRIFPEVRETLEAWKSQGFRLTVLSNWDERLIPLLKELRLDTFFEDIVVSGAVGFHKPNPVVFRLAERRWGVAPGEILHVGDSEAEDFLGPTEVGWQAMLVDRSGVNSHGSRPDLGEILRSMG